MKFIYEDVLRAVGEFGTWQLKMMFLLWIPMFMCGMQWITTDFMALAPKELFCQYENCTSHMNIFMEGKRITDKDRQKLNKYKNIFPDVEEEYRDTDLSAMATDMPLSHPFCKIYVPFIKDGVCYWNETSRKTDKTYECRYGHDKFEYPEDFEFETLVTEFGLNCDGWIGRFYFSFASASGSFFGSIVIAWLADKLGRRPSMLLSMLAMSLGAILETLMKDFDTVLVMTFINGFGKWALFQVCLLYLVEIIGFKKRFSRFYWISYNSVACITFMIPYCLGKIFATLFITYFTDWRDFERYLGIISLSQLIVVWFIPESPRWLLFHYKVKRAQKLLTKIAIANGEDVDIDITSIKREKTFDFDGAEIKDDLLKISFGRSKIQSVLLQQRQYSIKKICVPETVQYTVAFIWCWPMINFLRFGLVDAAQIFQNALGTAYYRSVIEIAGLLFTCFIEGLMGRRTALLTFMSVTTIMYFGISIKGVPIPAKQFMILGANLPSICANLLIIMFTLSVYPTSLRSKTLGLFTAWSSIGEILAPVLIDYVPHIYNEHEGAFFAMGLAALTGCCLCYYLPETLGRPLPETMDDVLYLRARNPPCCSLIKYKRKTNKAKYVPVETAPRIKIPNFDWAPNEEIREWRKQAFGVNHFNHAFNDAEIKRQTLLGRR